MKRVVDSIRHIKSRIRLPYEILKCKILNIHKPLVVLLYTNDRCNLACKYCVGNWSARKLNDFTTDEIKRIVDECKGLGSVHFTIHGGEILLRDDTKEIVDYLKNSGMYVNLVTNGLLLPEKIDEVVNVDSLCISLDGREENNDYTRGKGAYKAAMAAIKVARERKLRFVVHATLTKKNINDIEYLCEQARELNYYQQFSLLLKPLTEKQIGQDLGLSDEEARDTISKLIKLKDMGFPIFTFYPTLRNVINWPFNLGKSRLNRDEIPANVNLIKCYYGKLKIAIDADGSMYPCSSLNDCFKALNVKEVGVKKAFDHVIKTNTCEACYYLTQNDWSLLLGGSMKQFMNQAFIQAKGIFRKN
ncbi:MAG: radical SAM protein [Deltaproteobacteria bacterium]|nr:radical SAM protein [Deltaproteobacteria bacterium]